MPGKGIPPLKGGSRKGVPNKNTGAIKDMILGALSDVGGQKYLAEQAAANPVAFMGLIGKVLPMQVTGEGGAAIKITFTQDDAGVL
jgi:hypothetical protein